MYSVCIYTDMYICVYIYMCVHVEVSIFIYILLCLFIIDLLKKDFCATNHVAAQAAGAS